MGKFCKIFLLVSTVVLAFIGYKVQNTLYSIPEKPILKDTWWGPGSPKAEDTSIKPFKINISDQVIKDLQERLSKARPFHPPLEGIQQQYGMNTRLLSKIVDFWKTQYNWKEREAFLNQFPQFTTNIQGLKIHYLHIKPKETKNVKVIPLLMLHGWPGSIREFYEIIPLLTTPQKGRDFVFEVIAPSLPGYGFSDGASKPGLGPVNIAVVFKNLMKRIGYDKFYIQGGDWGAIIVQYMATLFPEHVLGAHSNMCGSNTPLANLKLFLYSLYPSLIVDKEHEHLMYPISKKFSFLLLESGYMHIQATKPDTVGVGLNDSPVGLAAYLIEKFTTWTNPEWKDLEDGGLTKKFTYTALLDNVMIYWVSNSITTSMRIYAEAFSELESTVDRIPVTVPSACARFSKELMYQPPALLEDKYPNLIHTVDYDGGHFASFELPEVMANDIYMFLEKVGQIPKKSTNK